MNTIRWDDVKEWFDPTQNGTVPDLVVPDTSLADWDALLTLARSQGWHCEYRLDDEPRAMPQPTAHLFVEDPDGAGRSLWIWPTEGPESLIVRPWAPDEIVGDISLHDIQGQEALDAFCRFLRTVGTALGKQVLLTPEGGADLPPLLVYDSTSDSVTFEAGPWQ